MKIAAGPQHILALKKVYRPPFREWSPEMVTEFFTTIGFDPINSAIINMKISAAALEDGEY